MRLRTHVWIEDDEGRVVYGLGRQRILCAIRDSGSIKAPAARLGMSYRGLWARLRHSERRLGFALVTSHPGRGAEGGTRLAPRGAELIECYQAMVEEIYRAAEEAFDERLRPLLTAQDARR